MRLKSLYLQDFEALFCYNRNIKKWVVIISMMTQENEKVRKQMQIVCIDDLVPQDHLLRIIEKAIDWSFIYELVEDK